MQVKINGETENRFAKWIATIDLKNNRIDIVDKIKIETNNDNKQLIIDLLDLPDETRYLIITVEPLAAED